MTALANRDLIAAMPRLRRYARVLTAELGNADALLIDTIELAKSGWPQRAVTASLLASLFALMRKLHLRAAQVPQPRVAAVPDLGAMASAPASADVLMRFAQLSMEEREVLLFAAVEGMRYEEIAWIADVPVATVISRLKRAREHMRSADAGCATPDGERSAHSLTSAGDGRTL